MAKTPRGRHSSGSYIIKGCVPSSIGRAVLDGFSVAKYAATPMPPKISIPSKPSNVRAAEQVRASFRRAFEGMKTRG